MKYLILLFIVAGCGVVTDEQMFRSWKLCEGSSPAIIYATFSNDMTEVKCADGSYREGRTFTEKK